MFKLKFIEKERNLFFSKKLNFKYYNFFTVSLFNSLIIPFIYINPVNLPTLILHVLSTIHTCKISIISLSILN